MDTLNILVIDARPAIALPVIDTLRELGHRAEVQNGGIPAITAVTTKRRVGRAYQLLLANFEMADVDPIEFLHTLRQHNEMVPVCFYANRQSLPREAFDAVEQLDGRFVSLPLDRARLEQLVTELLRHTRRTNENAPFFGTSRVLRRSGSGTAGTDSINREISQAVPSLPPENQLPPVTASISRRSAESVESLDSPFPAETPAPVLHGTAQFSNNARYLRSPTPDPNIPDPNKPDTSKPVTNAGVGTTSRIRRSVTGKIVNPAIQASSAAQSRTATCEACKAEFVAVQRAQAYSLPCIHCGHLNLIS